MHDVAILVPPPPVAPLGAMALAALLAGRGRSVALLEPPSPDPTRPEEPFLLPLPPDERHEGAGGLLNVLVGATHLPPLDRFLERPAVPCQLILPRHRLDLAADPAVLAQELAREWPEAAGGLTALERQLARLDASVSAAPPRLLVGSPSRLGRAGDLFAFVRRPRLWMRGQAALREPLPAIDGDGTAAGLAALAVALGGLGRPTGRLTDLWRPWAAARRGAHARPGAPGLVGQLRARAVAAGAATYVYEADGLEVTEIAKGLSVRASADAPTDAGVLASGWPAAGLAPRTRGRTGQRLARLAAASVPARWATRLVVTAPRRALPVGLGARAVLAGEPGPLLLEVSPGPGDDMRLSLTALLDRPVAEAGLAPRLRERLEWLVPFLPPGAPETFAPPDPRWPVRFAIDRPRPVAIPPLAARRLALVGPDVAPLLGPEGEVLAALAVAAALAPQGD
jgi:hypothetical protein